MKVSTRIRLLTILCMLLFAVTGWGLFSAFTVKADENDSSNVLTVEAIGWGGSAAEAGRERGVANVNEADRVDFQIWFSDALDSGTPTNLLGSEAGLAMDVVKSALQYIEINGKTLGTILEEVKAVTNGTTMPGDVLAMHIQGGSKCFQFDVKKSVKTRADGQYASLPDCYFNTETASPYKLTDDNRITVKAGFTAMGKTVAEDVTYVYNPTCLDGNGTWAVEADKEVKVTSVQTYTDSDNNVAIKLFLDSPIVSEQILHAARLTESTVMLMNGGTWDKLDLIKGNGLRYSIWNKLAVNGYTIRQLIDESWDMESDDPDGKLDVHLKVEDGVHYIDIRVKKGYAAETKMGAVSVVSVLKGFRSDLGKFSESVSYMYNEEEGQWTENGEAIVREELSVESITSKDDAANNEIAITVTFGGAINKETVNHMARENEGTIALMNGQEKLDNIKANGLRDSVLNKITIGGKTIYELIQLNKNTPGVDDYDGKLDVHVKAGEDGNKMEIHIKKGVDGSVALEEGLQLKFLKGFKSDLITVTQDIVYTYINGSWYAEGEEPPVQNETGITSVYQTIGDTDIQIYVIFDGSLNKESVIHIAREDFGTVQAQNPGKADHIKENGLYDSVREKVELNGKTLKELMAAAAADPKDSDASAAIDVHINDSTENNIMRIVLKKAYDFVDFDTDFTLTIKAGFHSDIAIVSDDLVYTYNSHAGIWLAPGETAPSFDAVTLIGIDAPDMTSASENKNVQFLLKFSENIDTRQHAYISTDKDLAAALAGSNYSASELTSFTKFSVFSTMASHILLNGKSIREMIDESGWAYAQSPNVATIHSCFEGTGLNTLRLVIGGEYPQTDGTVLHNPFQINDLNENFVITVKAGLRTPLGQEVKEDVSFIYDPVSQTWYAGDSVEDIPVYVTVTFKDGETVLSTQQCLAGETVVAGVARKEGYTFDGWYTDAALTQEWNSSTPVNEDITIYAKFTQNTTSGGEIGGSSIGCGSTISDGSFLAAGILAAGIVSLLVIETKRRKNIK